MPGSTPSFPPLIAGHRLGRKTNPFATAQSRARDGRSGAGDLFWSDRRDEMNFALVLEPDVEEARCPEMLFCAMIGFADAAGAICPPEIGISFQWPSIIQMNGARIGMADLEIGSRQLDGTPDWMVVGLRVRVKPSSAGIDPGETPDRTTMWDEGCGDLSIPVFLEAVGRHIVNWIHRWSEDGFGPVHENWLRLLTKTGSIAAAAMPPELQNHSPDFLGLDQSGNAIIKTTSLSCGIMTVDALSRIRERAEGQF